MATTSRPIMAAGVALLCWVLSGGVGRAFDFFGLFGAPEQATPTPNGIAYDVAFDGVGDDSRLSEALKDASNVWRLRLQPPSSGVSLSRRVVSDFPDLANALWASGYFDASVSVTVAGVAVTPEGSGADAAGKAAEASRGTALVPIRYTIAPGPLYQLRNVVIYDARTKGLMDPALIDRARMNADPVGPARAATVRSTQTVWIDQLRAQSYPLAKVVDMQPVVDHRAHVMDVAVTIDPGPRAGIGAVTVKGSPGVDPRVISSFIYLEEGEPYSPKRILDTRNSVSQIEAIGGVRVEDGERLDANGNLPILVETSERKRHAVALAAMYSNVDGPSVRASWTDRNLFGGAERLRLDAQAGVATIGGASQFTGLSSFAWRNVVGRVGASFVKPALGGTRNDLLVDVAAIRESTDYYYASYLNAQVALRHRFSEYLSAQIGVEAEAGRTVDLWGGHDYSLLGAPIAINYDSTDSKLAPTQGVRATLRVAPYIKALPHGLTMVQSKAQVSTYYAIDEEARYILAGRIGAGSTVGASIADVPANRRFFVGGGGSVRGYRYRSLSPHNGFDGPTGGLSYLEASLEARIRVTETIGIVPFVDAGSAYDTAFPNFKSSLRESVGLGLRYFTPIGPIRIDFAVPIARRQGESKFGVLIGVGEAF
ncbi:MAG TPA: BamA/TamA family outer membrane protein [Rhodoblastus sp.]|nr:BamA/TamA family outer membrane protein [Rhodoblastus sp.]